jgi:hypothetical protein
MRQVGFPNGRNVTTETYFSIRDFRYLQKILFYHVANFNGEEILREMLKLRRGRIY